jgi:quinol-cytochrome oxidoreductase complex cytochrome b subunit
MMIIMAALVTFISLIVTVSKLGPNAVKRLFGYDYVVDIVLGVFTMVIFAATATITGVLIAVLSNLIIGIGLWMGRNLYGYQKLERVPGTIRFHWVEYEARWVKDVTDPVKNSYNVVRNVKWGKPKTAPTHTSYPHLGRPVRVSNAT